MTVQCRWFVQDGFRRRNEFKAVRQVADRLLAHLNSAEAQQRIAAVNMPRGSSALIQGTFADFASELGFRSEARGLFGEYRTGGLRPDYYLPIGATGILLEVERGKTTINNMDLLDFWKCHLCRSADYLFLVVPKELRQNEFMAPRNEFASVVNRLSGFFEEPNYTNVRGLFVFGY
jgi:hypothetical protein